MSSMANVFLLLKGKKRLKTVSFGFQTECFQSLLKKLEGFHVLDKNFCFPQKVHASLDKIYSSAQLSLQNHRII